MAATVGKAVKRVYVVQENDVTKSENGETVTHAAVFLVRAGSQAQAIAHIVRGRFSAEAASTEDVLRLREVEVQDAGAE